MTEAAITGALRYILDRYGKEDARVKDIIFGINGRRDILFQYLTIKDCPRDTNLVELYNSHLQTRLKSIKSFQSIPAAKRWLNAYLIRRRTKTLTDCELKFKHLNGYPSLFWTIKNEAHWPIILGIRTPEQHVQTRREVRPRNDRWFQSYEGEIRT